MKLRSIGFGLAASTMLVCTPASSHHSLSAYDVTKRITVAGTIKRYEWSAPHCWLIVMAPDGKGAFTEWRFEAGTPVVNTRFGWTRDAFAAGQKITITAAPVRDNSPHGALILVEFADGRKLAGPLATYLKQ